MKNNRTIGKEAEDKASAYIKKQGLKILDRNYRCPYGEIDIIAEDKKQIVFIEVKYRKSNLFGKGYDAVDKRKQQKIIKTAYHYINKFNIRMLMRFDIVSIDNDEITYIRSAFGTW